MKFKLLSTSFILLLLCSLYSQIAPANEIEEKFIKADLIDIQTLDLSIQVDLVNSDPDKNYFREDFYKGLHKAYLQKEVAIKLTEAQKILKSKNRGYSLLILDAARPRSVSKLMFDKMKGTPFERYVADPENGSMHNLGIAVDITIVDETGEKLDMGLTPFFKSDIQLYWQFVTMKMGSNLTRQQKTNRKLLSDIMIAAGFEPLSFEWWHFNGMPKNEARVKYQTIE